MSLLNFKSLMNDSDSVFAENKLLKLGFIVLLICTLLNTVSIQRMDDKKQTHIIPLGTGMTYEFTNGSANDLYLKQMVRVIIGLRGNITSGNVEENFELLLSMYSEAAFGSAREYYKNLAEETKRYASVSYQVVIDGGKPYKIIDNSVIYVDALKKRIVGNSVASKTPLKYKITYEIRDGRFLINDLKELKP